MLRLILIPIAYIIGRIISSITKEELLIRKNWLKNWIYSLFLIIPAMLFGDNAAIMMICIINYLKSSYDLIYKTPAKAIILWNMIFILLGIIILVDW
jgi:biotin transporter BioY